MKISVITLATALALSTTCAMAQSGGTPGEMAASPTVRSSMNSMHRSHHRHMARDAETNRLNGHGINRLGVTTNSGRKYNGA
jgi:hypothetical protein